MNLLQTLGKNSLIYSATNMLQKGSAFLLMPLYTIYMSPADFGIIAVTTSINGFLSIFFTFALTSAITRFYFDYREDPEALAEFWGTIITAVGLLSIAGAAALLIWGPSLLSGLLGDVPFWPFMALGVITSAFQPLFTTYLAVLQTRNQAGLYSLFSLSNFLLTTALTIGFVVIGKQGAQGALVAVLISAVASALASLWMLRRDFRLLLRLDYLRLAFGYSLPQIPHSVASQVTATTNRLMLNTYLGATSTGLFSVGAMLALAVEVIAQSVNRAYVPLSMEALKQGRAKDYAQIQAMGSAIVVVFCMLGAAIASFSEEILMLLTASEFWPAHTIVGPLVFGGVASAVYYLVVNILFFDRSATKYLPLGTMTAAISNVSLNLWLIPRYGLMGAAVATVIAQVLATVLVASIGSRFDPVRWPLGRFLLAIGIAAGCSMALSAVVWGHLIIAVIAKVIGLVGIGLLISSLFWHDPLTLVKAIGNMVKRRHDLAINKLISEARL